MSKFGSSKDRDKGDMYNYYDVEKGGGGGQDSDSIVDFVPAPYDDEEEKEEKKAEKEGNQYKEEGEEQEEEEEVEEEEITSNEIPDLSSSSSHQVSHHSRHHSSSSLPRRHHGHHGNALRQAHIKSFRGRSGYHASTGPADFFKKKYRSEILEVSPGRRSAETALDFLSWLLALLAHFRRPRRSCTATRRACTRGSWRSTPVVAGG